jgi:hypothetical protein
MRYSFYMAARSLLELIDAEIAKLEEARRILAKATQISGKHIARAVKSASAKAPRKRVLSADARKRIADAQRRRWAAQRAKNKKEA